MQSQISRRNTHFCAFEVFYTVGRNQDKLIMHKPTDIVLTSLFKSNKLLALLVIESTVVLDHPHFEPLQTALNVMHPLQ